MPSSEVALAIAKDQLSRILYATVATCSDDGQPWNSPVYSAYDEDLNIYWASDVNAVHSQNIRANKRAFVVFYDSTVPEGTGQGLYFRCTATELQDPSDMAKGCEVLSTRVGKANASPDGFMNKSSLRVYRAVPNEGWVNDDELIANRQVDVRIRIDLAELHSSPDKPLPAPTSSTARSVISPPLALTCFSNVAARFLWDL